MLANSSTTFSLIYLIYSPNCLFYVGSERTYCLICLICVCPNVFDNFHLFLRSPTKFRISLHEFVVDGSVNHWISFAISFSIVSSDLRDVVIFRFLQFACCMNIYYVSLIAIRPLFYHFSLNLLCFWTYFIWDCSL